MKKLTLILSILAMSTAPVFANCFDQAGKRYGIEPELLKAIATVESGLNPKATNKNSDGSIDLGLMQINSTHLPKLEKMNITEKSLISDSCQNIMTGAWILAGNIKKYGYSWDAVGAYNAGTANTPQRDLLRKKYASKIAPEYKKIKEREEKLSHTA